MSTASNRKNSARKSGLGKLIVALAGLVGLLIVGGTLFMATSASAASTGSKSLCSGYEACEAAGMTTHGYVKNAQNSYWHSYAGHNCTNYVAFLMDAKGYKLPVVDGKKLSIGNATLWAERAASAGVKVDTKATVGSVAQWVAGGKISKYGHVAIVEKVAPEGITISEDNYKADGTGEYHWTFIPTGSSAFPTNFVHFVA